METRCYELECLFDSCKSFYGKAYVKVSYNENLMMKRLYSYNTLVASIVYDSDINNTTFTHMGYFSKTTSRHQKEFFKQEGLTDKEIEELRKA